MSMSYAVFVKEVPTRAEWQNHINQQGIPLILLESLEVTNYSGYVPMNLDGYKSGVEIYIEEFDPDYMPDANEEIGDRKKMVSFRLGGDSGEMCCASAAAAVLTKFHDGVAFFDGYPQTYELMMAEYDAALPQAKFELDPTKHNNLFAALLAKMPNYQCANDALLQSPVGDCALGIKIAPGSRFEAFAVGLVVQSLFVPTDYIMPIKLPAALSQLGQRLEIIQPSTKHWQWNYDASSTVDEIVDLVQNEIEPFIDTIRTPAQIADLFLKETEGSVDVYAFEKAGVASAAAGRYDDALNAFSGLKKAAGTSELSYITAMVDRANKIETMIKETRYEDIEVQLTEWKAQTVRDCGIS